MHPQQRFLPGLGARLGRLPRVSAGVFALLRRLPTKRLRAGAYTHAARPLAERMDAELLVRAVGGVRMIAHLSRPTGRTLATAGLWEWHVGEVIRELLRPGDVFVDVGANEGYYTALGARLVGHAGHVYALEPGPATYLDLRRNLAINGFDASVTALAVAAGSVDGRATLYGPAEGHDVTSSLRRPRAHALATEVPVRPLHAVISEEHRVRLKLVKIDVEGHEDDVLTGLAPLLERGTRPAILVEVHAAYNADAPAFVANFCRRYGLAARWLVEDERKDGRAPADRELVLRDLGSPPDFDSISRDRYALLLEPRS